MSTGSRALGRRSAGLLVGALYVAAVTGVLAPFRRDVTSGTPGLLLVGAGVVAGLAGGRVAAFAIAVVAAVVFNLVFLEPYDTFKVVSLDGSVALAVFVVVAVSAATLVGNERERRQAVVLRAEEIGRLWEANEAMRVEQARLAAEKEALEAVDEQRAAILRSVSHDLRTPLAAIRAVFSDLRDGTVYEDRTRQDLLDLVVDEADRLDRLVQNLLSMSRIEAGSLAPERQAIPIEELLAERVQGLARLLRDVSVSLDVDAELPLVDADYTMVEQVVTNLLDNAARHSPPGSSIVTSARRLGVMVEVAVSDQGSGIDPADRERLLRPFERGPGSRSSGLGLAICRALVEAHGGALSIADANGSAPASGARIAFTLPVHRG